MGGLALVIALHAAVLWGALQQRWITLPLAPQTLFVNLIPPPPVTQPRTLPPPPKLPPTLRPPPQPSVPPTVAALPIATPTEPTLPPAPLQPADVAPPPPAPAPPAQPAAPAGPVALGGELAVVCPQRAPPRYPATSRRLGEEGTVVLRVELDEHGKVCMAQVSASSGFARLDTAALEAVRGWHCQPAQRNGRAVRAIAMQPFTFVLQEG